MYHGVPCGRNSPKKPTPCLMKPMIVVPMKISSARPSVTTSCAVNVVTVRQHSEHVAEQDEEEQGKDERKIGLPAAAYVCFNMFATNS